MQSALRWLRAEALSNPVILRESGLAYCKRELGMNPGRGKLLLTAGLGLLILGSPFLISARGGVDFDGGILVAIISFPIILGAAMIDAPRAFSGGTDRAYTEDLLMTPLGSQSIAHGKVFARGLPIFVYSACVGALGVGTLLIAVAGLLSDGGRILRSQIPFSIMCIISSALVVRCYLGGLRAGLHERNVGLRAIASYLKALSAGAILFLLMILYTDTSSIPRGGVAVGAMNLSFDRGLNPARQVFRLLVVLSGIPFLFLWCRGIYVDLVQVLERELKRRLGLLDE